VAPGTRGVARRSHDRRDAHCNSSYCHRDRREPAYKAQPIVDGKVSHDFGFEVMCIIVTITGTATTPLMTAVQYSALIGLMGRKFMLAPASVASVRVI